MPPLGPRSAISALITLDLTGFIKGWDSHATRLLGYSPMEMEGQHLLVLLTDDAFDDSLFAQISNGAGGDESAAFEVNLRAKSGILVSTRMHLHLIRDDAHQPKELECRLHPMEQVMTLEDRARLYVRIIEESGQGILITDHRERIVMVNRAFTQITGYSAAEAFGQTPDLLRSGKHSPEFRTQVRSAMQGSGPWTGEIIGRRKNGELFAQSVSIGTLHDHTGTVTHAFSVFSDISAIKATEARLERLANFDQITDLPNRSLFIRLMDQTLSLARRANDHAGVMVLQLQRMNTLSDTLGHEIADDFLVAVAERLRRPLRQQDILARIGHDKFAVGLPRVAQHAHAWIVAEKLQKSVAEPIIVAEHSLQTEMTIGIALHPDNGGNTYALLRSAELASIRAFESDEERPVFFSAEMNERSAERFRIESELRHAIAADHLVLYHQPKVSLRTGHIVGAEALLRWHHEVHGLLGPGSFVPVAEETHLILELGDWVLDAACRQLVAWREQGLSMPPLAVNLSARQFDLRLPKRLDELLGHYHLEPRQLKLEITESLMMRGAEQVIPVLNDLVAMGFGIALDDFGTGYSSLAYLKRFPISTLKIDRSFVIGIPQDNSDCAIARAIVTMGQTLRHELVAEGVETRAQMQFLRKLGCDQLQGYLFSKPLCADDYATLVREGTRLDLEDLPA